VLYDLEPEKLKYDFVNSLIDTIFVKDLIPRFKIKDITLLKELFLFLVNNIGNITNLAGILTYLMSKGISTNLNTLGSYVEILKSAYLVYEVNLYDLQGKKVFDRERKFYI
jgi:predicted AAA+ superfamily ATPase